MSSAGAFLFFVRIDLSSLYRVVVRPLLWLVLGVYFLLAVALVALRYAVLPNIDEYRPAIERMVGQALGTAVNIGRIDAEWRGLHPSLELSAVQVRGPAGQPGLELPRVSAILSWRSLLAFAPRTLRLQLEAPRFDIRRDAAGRYWVAGLPFDPGAGGDSRAGLKWLLAQREIVIRGAQVRWTDERRGAPPLVFDNAVFVMQNAGLRHRAALRAQPPAELGAGLDARAEFTHRWFTLDASDPASWQGSLYLDTGHAELAGWQRWVDLPGRPQAGSGAMRAWLTYDRGKLRSGTVDAALDEARLQLVDGLPVLGVAQASGRASVVAADGGYRLDVTGLQASTDDGLVLAPTVLRAAWRPGRAGEAAATELDAAGVDLDAGRRLADRLPLSEAQRAMLAKLRPQGRIETLHLAWRGAPDRPEDFQAKAAFSGLSIAAAPEPAVNDGEHPQRPGFSNLSGTLEADARGGRVDIDARNAVLSFPGVFAAPDLPMDTLQAGAAAARQEDGSWTVRLERLDFARSGVSGSFNGTWSSRGKSPAGTLDLRGGLGRADVRQIHLYIPLVVGDDVRTWLRQALLAGQARDVDVRLRGDLDTFPFANDKSGEFRVAGKVRDVTLDYLPEPFAEGGVWPRLEELAGEFVFDRASMAVDVRSGRVRVDRETSVALGRTRATIADLEHAPRLAIDGETRGAAPAFLAFVKRSPVGRMIDGVLDEASASGNFTVPLSLRIPLDAHEEEVEVKGEVRLAGNDFHLMPRVPAFSRLSGVVGFDNHGISLRDVGGMALGGPVRLSGGPQADGSSELRAQGTAEGAALTLWWNAPGMARIAGHAAYRATVRIKPARQPELLVESDLVGLSVDLPAPLGKTAQERRPSRLEWGATAPARGQSKGDWFAGSLGPAVNLHVERDFDDRGDVGQVRGAVGIRRAATIMGPGLGVSAELDEVDLDQLGKIAAEFAPMAGKGGEGAAAAPELPLNRISLAAQSLRVHGRQFDKVKLYAVKQPAGAGPQWRADVESTQLAGQLAWSMTEDGAAPTRLTARLSRLVVDGRLEGQDRARFLGDAEPEDEVVPEIDLVAEHVELFGKELGRLEVQAQSSDRGREWRLRKLSLKTPEAELDGTGVWKVAPGGHPASRRVMSLDAVLKLADAGKFLERMGVRGTMAGGAGTLAAQVSWRGLPYSLDIPSLSGTVALALDKGQFLKADPGIAKLLGVLSLQSLPRRVTLDFRDIFSEGFAYDTIRAHARIANGVAHTDDFKMNGVNATVVIAGDADLEKETQKLHVVVVPKLDAGAASLLYGLAVNPAVGLSVFLAQLLLKDPLSQVLAYQYEVSGSWSDPQVAKVQGSGRRSVDAPDSTGEGGR
ncbi:hypothetical protein PIGHUM_00617 [Pigmentiphaga humi]|uniref:YhdP central domain-containing protein n=1 Tax=Pigmentiphaga humi TaxID=2478468 RepID=A0A3P4AYP0_9BURK|nr:YhdP family protein [Pigmentiphaga humi]VCU68560.1 hypothetical protein PIGHUM_00617 [Pigmentiphaga humi]